MDVERKLSEYVDSKCINKQALAEKTGINYQTLYRCLRAEQELKASEFLAICTVLEINPKDFLKE